MPATSKVLAYTAGLMDGEGCIYLHHCRHTSNRCGYAIAAEVNITNTNEWLIRWLQFQFGGGITSQKHKANWKRAWAWRLTGRKAEAFLKLLLPYLLIKRPQAELVIAFCKNLHTTKPLTEEEMAVREAQYLVMKGLNQKGVENVTCSV